MSNVIRELSDEWYAAGIRPKDIVLLHSNIGKTLKRFLRKNVRISPEIILQSFLDVLSPEGTILLPLFNFDFTRGIHFDIRKTPSRMGALTEAGRSYPGAVRTGHPIYSFAVIGHEAKHFENVNNFSGYGEDSPFGLLRQLNGKIAVLNLLDSDSMTFYHHVEEMLAVPYRYHKKFVADYTDWDGMTEKRTYSLFVRNLEQGVKTHVDPAGELMWQQGLYKGFRPDQGSGLRIVSAQKMYDFVSGIIQSGKAQGLLYILEGERDGG